MGLNPIGNPDWPKQTADLLEQAHELDPRQDDQAGRSAITRALVFGLLAAFVGLVAVVLLLVIATRALQILIALPLDHDTQRLDLVPRRRGIVLRRRVVADGEASRPERRLTPAKAAH